MGAISGRSAWHSHCIVPLIMTTTTCRLSIIAKRQRRRAIVDVLVSLAFVCSSAANLGILLTI